MNRRQFGKRIALGAGSVLAVSTVATSCTAAADKPEQSPHAEALALVFRKAGARIRAVDKGDWWMDTEERSWDVQRPFGPGGIDSTHMFTVAYKIAGKPVAAWWVDTRERKVEETPLEQPQRRKSPRRSTPGGVGSQRKEDAVRFERGGTSYDHPHEPGTKLPASVTSCVLFSSSAPR